MSELTYTVRGCQILKNGKWMELRDIAKELNALQVQSQALEAYANKCIDTFVKEGFPREHFKLEITSTDCIIIVLSNVTYSNPSFHRLTWRMNHIASQDGLNGFEVALGTADEQID